MDKITHVIDRKEFIQNGKLKQYLDVEQPIEESSCLLQNILSREDFVSNEDLKDKYTRTNIPLLESNQNVKLLGKEVRVLGFEDYLNSKNKKKAV